ncbi:ABC transporter substrate-binding protein [Halalkalibacter hemicellulosilyticus]|uniref:Rhamnose oligosaccharide ABC transport system n=1 Tax=Halalkalibacter hemicellulosilyticusJCM 9152 TaxID=1236971 RepID=W4QLW9_9BACI|nr:sugar ABC transporter substrate-binding protein [Halalkalibacter hemicellulosilyticus]GAE32638.1 rhamnose oligosaccharide ABC transport system [Halalkalibacter hemicellulosilyticusJCM 9152]
MKKWFVLLIGFMLMVMLVACGDSNDDAAVEADGDEDNEAVETDDDDTAVEEQEDITLRIAWWGDQPRHELTNEVIEMFQEQNPHIRIEPEYAGWDDYWQRLAPQAAANELPDIIQMDLSRITQYADNNQLADLTPYIGERIDVSNIADTIVSGGEVNDGIYGFNLGVNAVGFHYNPALLEELGVDEIPEDWTWDDYIEISEKAADAGVYFDTGMKADVFFHYYLRTHGHSLYGADGGLGYDDDQLFIDFFTMVKDQVEKGLTPTPDYLAQLSGFEDDPVVKGEGVGIWQWSNQFVGLQQVAGVPFNMHPMPGPGASDGLFLKPSMYFSIAENSEHKEAAAQFIDFWVNDIEANKIILGDRGVPGSSAVKDALASEVSEAQAAIFEYIEWAEQNSSDMGPPDPAEAGQIIDLLDNLAEEMAYGQATPEDAADRFRQQAEGILN